MAQPLAKCPPFCLLLYSTDSKYTAEAVMNRWNFIEDELAKASIKVLSFSSDSDPKNNSGMRKRSLLGHASSIFDNCVILPDSDDDSNLESNLDACSSSENSSVKWFYSGRSELDDRSFDMQDTPHIATKMRNFFLKTKRRPQLLRFGNYYIQMSQLVFLLKHYKKDEHLLTESTLNPIDRQNYSSVVRMCSDKVIDLLTDRVPRSQGTVMFLKLIRDIIDAFSMKNISPLHRIKKIWYTLFLIRIWHNFVSSTKGLKLKDNFLTTNCYSCVELNAHNLVFIMLYLKRNDMSDYFLPFLYNSQPCEAFFRQIRSFTSTYSSKANCSVKEILGRIDKIQLLSDISIDTRLEFPRVDKTHQFRDQIVYQLPSKEEIFTQIEKCRMEAVSDAIKVGLLKDNYSLNCISCKLESLEIKPNKNKKNVCVSDRQMIPLKRVALKNFAYKFSEKIVPENSSYVEILSDKSRRHIVKKTSLCWLLRPDQDKLSSDRVLRVRGALKHKPKIIPQKINTTKRKKRNLGLIYNPNK